MRSASELEEARQLLRRAIFLLDECGAQNHLFDRVVDAVCQSYGIERNVLLGRRRYEGLAQARQVAMYLCSKYNAPSEAGITEVAEYFSRDRTTVLWAVKTVEGLLSYDKKFKARVYAINAACSNPTISPSLSSQ